MRLLLLVAIGCGPTAPSEVAQGLTPLDIVITGLDDIALEAASLRVEALVLDRCGDTTLVFPIDEELDVLGPVDEDAWMLPGGYCAAHLLLPAEEPDLTLAGDGGSFAAVVELGSVTVLEPFIVGTDPLLLEIPIGEVTSGESDIGPIVAKIWVDVDGDGLLGPDDVPAS